MKLLEPKVWSVGDIACLKWSSILFGMIAGAYLSDFIRQNLWLFSAGCIALAVKPTVAFFRKSK